MKIYEKMWSPSILPWYRCQQIDVRDDFAGMRRLYRRRNALSMMNFAKEVGID